MTFKHLNALPEYDRQDDGDWYVAIGFRARTPLGRMLAPGFRTPDIDGVLSHASVIGAAFDSRLRDTRTFTKIFGPEYDTALPPTLEPHQKEFVIRYLREVYRVHPGVVTFLQANTNPYALLVCNEGELELVRVPPWYLECIEAALPAPPSS